MNEKRNCQIQMRQVFNSDTKAELMVRDAEKISLASLGGSQIPHIHIMFYA